MFPYRGWPLVAQLLWHPLRALDCVDDHGKVDHGKAIGVVFVLAVLIEKAWGVVFSVGELIVLASAIFGARMFMAFLKSKAATSTESRTIIDQTTRVIQERRTDGVEPTHD
jgi:hypothetical protein